MMSNNHFLVIGGTKGTGKELVNILVSDENNKVSVFGRTHTFETKADNRREYVVDITNQQQVMESIESATAYFGKLSTVVFLQRYRSTGDEFDKDLMVSITATKKIIDFLVTGDFFLNDHLSKSIVMVSSIADNYIAEEQPAGYHVAKAGLVQLARFYALTLGKLGIRVNCVSPCVVAKKEAAEFYRNNPQLVQKLEKYIPLRRMGASSDIANAVIFLAGEKASYITGQNLVVDGGLTLRSHESIIRDNV